MESFGEKDSEREKEKDKDRHSSSRDKHGESRERRHRDKEGDREKDRDPSRKHRDSSRRDGEEKEKKREDRHKGRRGSDALDEAPVPPKQETKITYEEDDQSEVIILDMIFYSNFNNFLNIQNEGNTSRKRPTSAKGPRSHIDREENGSASNHRSNEDE